MGSGEWQWGEKLVKRRGVKPTTLDLKEVATKTVGHYEANATRFWEGTKDHDVTQNYEALLGALPKKQGLRILDFGCGPGRDLLHFKSLGHFPTGLDGSSNFCSMARDYSGCPVLHQNFLQLDLPKQTFDGIFANASLFHIPRQELVRVLSELRICLVPQGVLFSSNPRGSSEGWMENRYGAFFEWEEYEEYLRKAGFEPLQHYYRPAGLPRSEQLSLASVSQLMLHPG